MAEEKTIDTEEIKVEESDVPEGKTKVSGHILMTGPDVIAGPEVSKWEV